MKIVALAYINNFDNEIRQRILRVPDCYSWKDVALECQDFICPGDDQQMEWIQSLDEDLDLARLDMINGEVDIVVTTLYD